MSEAVQPVEVVKRKPSSHRQYEISFQYQNAQWGSQTVCSI
ncbi:hypothetical protein RB628_37120 [Streptomyces sp. ADMS]|nr:hypothetical protein [Streptomyces sp. ADMS]MDW4910792.1 hypothetical protein [Streptomyces sp. ADMS]